MRVMSDKKLEVGTGKVPTETHNTKNTIQYMHSGVLNVSVDSDLNHPDEFLKLERWQKLIVTTWIKENFVSRVTINKYHTSYEMKHIFERSPDGFYLTNGAFKGAMLKCGFDKHSGGINWCFQVTERSIKEARKGMCY